MRSKSFSEGGNTSEIWIGLTFVRTENGIKYKAIVKHTRRQYRREKTTLKNFHKKMWFQTKTLKLHIVSLDLLKNVVSRRLNHLNPTLGSKNKGCSRVYYYYDRTLE